MNRKTTLDKNSTFFWNTAFRYINDELPCIRRKSVNTTETYRRAINRYIDFLEKEKSVARRNVSYQDFNKENLKTYLFFMIAENKLSEKTCNLQLTAIRSLLSYAAEEASDIMPIYLNSKSVKGLTVSKKEIEFFENAQLEALLSAPSPDTRLGRRDRMILILGYDAGLRVSELTGLKLSDIKTDAEPPYICILGKGRKYRNVPLMEKTVQHLEAYFREYHPKKELMSPLFYVVTHGKKHRLSDDTIQSLLKKHTDKARHTVVMPEKVHFHMIRNPNLNKIQTFHRKAYK